MKKENIKIRLNLNRDVAQSYRGWYNDVIISYIGFMDKNLGVKIRYLRENRNISQNEIAIKLGIHRPSVSQVERGYRNLSPEELLKLAQLFGVSVDELLDTSAFAKNKIQSEKLEKMSIAFIRHGEATDDIYNQYGGWADPELTPKGILTAYEVGNKLKDKHYDMVFVSPLKRAKRMGEIISSIIKADLKVLQYLKERNSYGILCGVNKEIAKRKYPDLVEKYNKGEYVFCSETVKDFEDRMVLLVNYFKRHMYKNIICITHGTGNLKVIAKNYLGLIPIRFEDGCLLETEFDGEHFKYLNSSGVVFDSAI